MNYIDQTLYDPEDYTNMWPDYFNSPAYKNEPYMMEATGDIAKLLITVNMTTANNLFIHFAITGGPNNKITINGLNGWVRSFNYTAQNMTYWNNNSVISSARLQYLQNFYNDELFTGSWSMVEININASVPSVQFTISSAAESLFSYYYTDVNGNPVYGSNVPAISIDYTQPQHDAGMPFYIYLTPGTYTVTWAYASKSKTHTLVLYPFSYRSFFGDLDNSEVNINDVAVQPVYGYFNVNSAQFNQQWAVAVYVGNTLISSYNSTDGGSYSNVVIPSNYIAEGSYITIILSMNISGINGHSG